MADKSLAIAGFVLVVLSLAATICVFGFAPALRECASVNVLGFGAFVFCVVGTVLGVLSRQTPLGKAAYVLGVLIGLLFLLILCWTDAPKETSRHVEEIRIDPPTRSQFSEER